MVHQTYSLFELSEQIRRTVALNFAHPIWIQAEIAQLNESRGHYYLQLVEKSELEDQLIAKADAVLWQSKKHEIKRKVGKIFHSVLQEGKQVSVQVSVEYDERYGLKLIIQDIDPSYTLGQLQLDRQKILERLDQLKLLGKNKQARIPTVLQNIAILSSESAAGYTDFMAQLNQNPYGYYFNGTLFPIAVQGKDVAKDVVRQLSIIDKRHDEFDCVVIVRGGGAKLDLAGFDDFEIGKAIANAKLPILSGIGHEIDETIADIVVHTALKTPTAVADFFIQHNANFEGNLDYLTVQLRQSINEKVQNANLQLLRLEEQLKQNSKQKLELQGKMVDYLEMEVRQLYRQGLLIANKDLQKLEQLTNALSIETNFKRGFTLTEHEGVLVTSATKLQKGDKIMTRFVNGEKLSIVN